MDKTTDMTVRTVRYLLGERHMDNNGYRDET
jgi:hypothetical protein